MDKQRNEKCSSGNKTIFAWAGGIVVVIGMVWLMVISFISYKTQVMTNQLLDKISTSLAKNPAVQQGVNGNIQDEVKGALRGRFRIRNLKYVKECEPQQRQGFAQAPHLWKPHFRDSRNSAVSAVQYESGFRESNMPYQHCRV